MALLPSAGVLFLFAMAMKAMVEGDRRERTAQAQWEKAHARVSDAGYSRPDSGSGRPAER